MGPKFKDPEWEKEHGELHAKAGNYLLQNACTTWNEETQTYDKHTAYATTARQIGEITKSVGIELYFILLKRMGFVFLIMFFISSPTLILSCMGKMLDAPSAMSKGVAMTSVANIGQCPPTGCRSQMEERERCLFKAYCSDGDWTTSKFGDLKVKDVTPWLGMLDGIAILIFMGWSAWFLQRTIPRETKAHDLSILSPSDYTCEIRGLPAQLDPSEHKQYAQLLKEHIQKVLSEAKEDAIPADQNPVHEISLVRDYHGAIATFAQKGEALLNKENEAKLVKLAERKQELLKDDEKQKVKAEKNVEKAKKDFEKRETEVTTFATKLEAKGNMADDERPIVRAFAILKTIQFKEKLEFEYRYNQYSIFRCCEPERLRFKGAKINVLQAPEPSDLFWENLDFPYWQRVARKVVVMLVTLILLLVCIFALVSIKASTVVVAGNSFQNWVVEGDGCFKLCAWNLYGTTACSPAQELNSVGNLFDYNQNSADGNYLSGSTGNCTPVWESPGCDRAQASLSFLATNNWIGMTLDKPTTVHCMTFIQDVNNSMSEARVFGCETMPNSTNRASWTPSTQCIKMVPVAPDVTPQPGNTGVFSKNKHIVKDTACATDAANFMPYDEAFAANVIGNRGAVNCFCIQQLSKDPGMMTPPYETPEALLCKEWSIEQAKVYGMMGLGIIAVVLINAILKLVFSYLTSFKRLETLSENTSSQLQLLFLSQFINTGILVFAVNAKLAGLPDGISQILTELFQIGKGSYYEPNADWFIAVGAGLCITIFSQVFSTTLVPVVMSRIVAPLLMWWARRSDSKVTFDVLKSVYVYPEWELGQRAAESLNIIACIIFYSGGMPALYAVGALYCALAYNLDKLTLLTGSKKPPAYNSDIIAKSMRFVPLFAFLHVLFACFVLSNPDIFPSDWSILRGLAEGIFGVYYEDYDNKGEGQDYLSTMMNWESADEKGKNEMFLQYLRCRFLDFSRKSVWLLMLLFLVGCVYYILYYLYVYLLAPVLAPFLFALKSKLPCCKDDGEEQTETFEEAVEKMKKEGTPAGYSMLQSDAYAATAKAIQHQGLVHQESMIADAAAAEQIAASAAPPAVDATAVAQGSATV